MRHRDANMSMVTEGRCLTSAEASGADVGSWGGTYSNPVGGHLVYGPFKVLSAADIANPTIVTLDAEWDWRDRVLDLRWILLVRGATVGVGGEAAALDDLRPGTADSSAFLRQIGGNFSGLLRADCAFYTGAGWDGTSARGGVNKFTWCEPVNSVNTYASDYRLYADSATGHLKLMNKSTAVAVFISGFIMAMVSEQTGWSVSIQ